MNSESVLVKKIMLALSSCGARVLRNNVGNGFLGKLVAVLPNGDAVLRDWRRVQFGLAPGSSDLIGWHPVVITPDMVGRTVAVFCAVEAKTAKGRTRENQTAFLNAVSAAGGIGVLARSPEEAVNQVLRLSEH